MTAPGARLLVCQAGLHPMTPENTYTRADGNETCRPCKTGRRREARAAARLPLPVRRPPAWMDRALCAESDPGLWFPDKGRPDQAQEAKQVCSACPVRAECLDCALANGEQHGIFGGLTRAERQAEARRRRDEVRAA